MIVFYLVALISILLHIVRILTKVIYILNHGVIAYHEEVLNKASENIKKIKEKGFDNDSFLLKVIAFTGIIVPLSLLLFIWQVYQYTL